MQFDDPRLLHALRDLIDKRAAALIREQVRLERYGVVAGDPDTTARTVAVRLLGQPQPAPGFVYGEVTPRDGDRVRVRIGIRGDRYVDAVLGRDPIGEAVPVLPPGTTGEEPADRALGALARVLSATASITPTLLAEGADAFGVTTGIAIPTGASPGDVMLAVFYKRDGIGACSTSTPGWSLLAESTGAGSFDDTVAVFGHVVTGAETTLTTSIPGNPSSGVAWQFIRVPGVQLPPDDTATNSGSGSSLTAGAATLSNNGLVLGAFSQLSGSSAFSPSGGWAIIDAITPISSHPSGVAVYQNLAGGSHTPAVSSSVSAAFRGVAVALSVAATDLTLPAPAAVDGDDATFATSGLAEAVRLDLGEAERIVRTRVLLAPATAGSKTYALRAATESDFGDEVTVRSWTFTATGAYATHELEGVWAATGAYRYWRLVGPAETRRVHSIELYEQAANQLIVTNPVTGLDDEIDDALAALYGVDTAHAAAADPHPGYATAAEVAAYASPLGHTHAGAPLSNYAATTDPTTGDDSGDGYAVGSRWVNTTTDEEFVCTDASAGAAVWVSTTAAGSFSGDAGDVPITDAAGYFTGTDVEAALQELAGRTFAIVVHIDGGGATITTGVKLDVSIPFACILTGWRLLADQSGSIVVDVWKDTYANYPPTDADAMPGAGKEPTISSATKAEDTAITDWATDDVAAGDTLRVNVDSCTSIQRATLVLTGTRV